MRRAGAEREIEFPRLGCVMLCRSSAPLRRKHTGHFHLTSMPPSFYRPLGRLERWLATRAELGVYTSVCAYARLGRPEGADGDASKVTDSIRKRLAELSRALANLRLVVVERDAKAAQEFFDLGEIDSSGLPIEVKNSDSVEESDRTAELERSIEALLVAPFPIVKLPGFKGAWLPDRPPAHPHPDKLHLSDHSITPTKTAKWTDFLRWKLVILSHASGEIDLALAYAHDIADGKSGLAMLKMIFDEEFAPFADWKSVVPDCPELEKFPGAHPPVDAVARETSLPLKKLLVDAFKELVLPPKIKRKFFLANYYTGNNPPDGENGQSVPSIAQITASPTRIRLFELPASHVTCLLEACRAKGLKLHALLVAAALIATSNLAHRISLRRPDLILTGFDKRTSTLAIKCNTPVDLRGNSRLPTSGPAFPIGAFIATAESTHPVPLPCQSSSLWTLAREASLAISSESANAPQLLGTLSYIGDNTPWHTFQLSNRTGHPSGRMESIMVSNILTWSIPPFLGRSIKGGFAQCNEVTGALVDLDVATVDGVLGCAVNFREGIGGIDSGDVGEWIGEWRGLLDGCLERKGLQDGLEG